MNKKSFISILLLFLFLVSIFSGVTFAQSYSIPSVNMDLFPQSDGTLHIKEVIHYSFTGTYHGVYRDIPLSGSQKVENIKVSTQGAYSTFTATNQENNEHITVYLYSNSQKTAPISDKDVNVTIEYDIFPVIKFYNDIAELQYKLIGESWAKDIGTLSAYIHLKSSKGVQYWLNPPYYAENSSWQGSTLQINSKTIPSGNYFEVRLAIPKDQFAANPTNGIIINQNGLSQIEAIQNNYQNQLNFQTKIYSILAVLLLLICVIPLLIYFRYGREPKIGYNAIYERDIPTDDPPAIVNAICGGISKKVGEPDMDGFKATIMDLIDRNYLLLKTEPSDKEGLGLSNPMSLAVNPKKDDSDLKEFELDVLNFLKEYEEDGLISLDNISASLSDSSNAQYFRDTYKNWIYDIKSKFLTSEELNKLFNKKGDKYLKIFGVLGLIAAILTFFFTIFNQLPAARYALVSSIVLGLVAIISIIMPPKIAGQWTTYGEEYDAKWNNFKKYIKDFSLIKEYPPESVAIWNKYLVYATALGAADAVRKAMELYLPKEQLETSDIYMFHYYGGYALLASSFNTGMSTAASGNIGDPGDFGGVGDIGGGFGGGGGGAF